MGTTVDIQLVTAGDCIHYGVNLFDRANLYYGHGTDNAWDESVALVLHCLNLPVDSGTGVLNLTITDEQRDAIVAIFDQRVSRRIPAPYLTGESWFAGLRFCVDERVLIPRSPFAELIEQKFVPWLYRKPKFILDLCTGSGCIGIACAVAFPDAEIVLSDISEEALAIAQQNIDGHNLANRVGVCASDLLDELSGSFDLIVANPPYVGAEELAAMPVEYRSEPVLALASGLDGLDITRRLLRQAPRFLTDGGCLCVEVGDNRRELEKEFPRLPFSWPVFERGGHGIFVIYKEDLIAGLN
jgi:ribosomal protein L3 glutamine methyltransferase